MRSKKTMIKIHRENTLPPSQSQLDLHCQLLSGPAITAGYTQALGASKAPGSTWVGCRGSCQSVAVCAYWSFLHTLFPCSRVVLHELQCRHVLHHGAASLHPPCSLTLVFLLLLLTLLFPLSLYILRFLCFLKCVFLQVPLAAVPQKGWLAMAGTGWKQQCLAWGHPSLQRPPLSGTSLHRSHPAAASANTGTPTPSTLLHILPVKGILQPICADIHDKILMKLPKSMTGHYRSSQENPEKVNPKVRWGRNCYSSKMTVCSLMWSTISLAWNLLSSLSLFQEIVGVCSHIVECCVTQRILRRVLCLTCPESIATVGQIFLCCAQNSWVLPWSDLLFL